MKICDYCGSREVSKEYTRADYCDSCWAEYRRWDVQFVVEAQARQKAWEVSLEEHMKRFGEVVR